MDIFWNIFESILILLGIGVVGFTIISRKIVPIKILDVVSPLIIDIALPALIFYNIFTRFTPEKFELWWALPIWWIGFTFATFILMFIAGFFVAKKYKSEFSISLLYPNSIFLPLLVIQNLFGDNSDMLVELFLFTLILPAFMFNTYYLFFPKREEKGEKTSWLKFLNPVLIATIVAIVIKLTGMQEYVPQAVIKVSKIIGNTALPLILIVIGGNVYVDFQRKGKIRLKEILIFVFIKNIIFPLIILGLILLIKPPFSVAFLFILLSAAPPITTIPILTTRVGGDVPITNQFLIASYITCIISLPLIILLFNNFYKII